MKAVKEALHDGFGIDPVAGAAERLRADPVRRDRRAVRRAADARRRRASRAAASTGSACRRPPTSCTISSAGSNASPTRRPRRLSGRPRDRRRHRLHAGHRSRAEFSKRGMCARDPKRALADGIAMGMPRKSRRRRRLRALLAGRGAALRPQLAAGPHAERRLPRRQYASRRHLAVRHPAAGLCRRSTAARSIRPPKAMRSSPTTWSVTCARSSTSATWPSTRRGNCSFGSRSRLSAVMRGLDSRIHLLRS